MAFQNARVLSFESRREKEMAELIRINGGEPFIAPALIEVPIEENSEALKFVDRLYAGEFEIMIFLTGVGARLLAKIIAARDGEERFLDALRRLTIVARGPKPMAVLREWNIPVAVAVPEPNTWRELLEAVRDKAGKRVAVQEYGRPNQELVDGLQAQGRSVTSVPVYQWRLPANTAPLARAVSELVNGKFEVSLFTTGVQVEHFLDFAQQQELQTQARDALQRTFIGSIGPTCSEALRERGLTPALEPSHPKMGILVREAAIQYEQQRVKKASQA